MRLTHLIHTTHLPLNQIQDNADGGLRLGALVTNAETAYHPEVEKRYPLLSRQSFPVRRPNFETWLPMVATFSQRTRCYYFYDTSTPCNKREPGTACSAIEGFNRMHAILGASDQCIAVHPSDMCVALAALEANVQVTGKDGDRTISFADFHRLPGGTPEVDTNLEER